MRIVSLTWAPSFIQATGWGVKPQKRSDPVDRRRHVADRAVWSEGVVVVLPGAESNASVSERCEECLIEQFIAQPTVEALDEGVPGGSARRNVAPLDASLMAPVEDRLVSSVPLSLTIDAAWRAG